MYTGQTTLSVSQLLNYTQFPTQRNLNGISKGIQQIAPIVVGDSGNIFRSSSPAGSIIWTKVSSPTTNNLKAISANQAYVLAVGENGTLIRSINQGTNWSALASQGNYSWNDVFLLEQNNNLDPLNRGVGLVVGSSGKVLRYTSFGNTVTQIDLGSSENLLKINAVAGGKVTIGSSTGKVFVSSDYGQSFYVANTFARPIRAISGFRSNEIQVIDGNNFIHHLDEFIATSVDYIPTTIPLNGAIYAEVGVGAGLSGGNIVFGNYGNLLSNTYPVVTSTKPYSTTQKPISLFPNPTNSSINFIVHSAKISSIRLLDLSGKVQDIKLNYVINGSYCTGQANLESLSSGVYILEVSTPTNHSFERIIKQ